MYRDNYKSGGSGITERLYIDVKQDFLKNKKKIKQPSQQPVSIH